MTSWRVSRGLKSERNRFRHAEHGAAAAQPARQLQERIAASKAKSPAHCVSGRKEGAALSDDRRR